MLIPRFSSAPWRIRRWPRLSLAAPHGPLSSATWPTARGRQRRVTTGSTASRATTKFSTLLGPRAPFSFMRARVTGVGFRRKQELHFVHQLELAWPGRTCCGAKTVLGGSRQDNRRHCLAHLLHKSPRIPQQLRNLASARDCFSRIVSVLEGILVTLRGARGHPAVHSAAAVRHRR
jgi:hypothetical protein